MSDRKAIEARIAELKGELERVEGRPTEVYSRIVGYYRSVRNWNAGKRSEYAERRAFGMPAATDAHSREEACACAAPAGTAPVAAAASGAAPAGGALAREAPAREAPAKEAPRAAEAAGQGFLVFTRAACPNCPPVKNYVVGAGLPATFVDVDGEEGLALARAHGVLSTPTVLGLDAQGREFFRALDLGQLKAGLGAARA